MGLREKKINCNKKNLQKHLKGNDRSYYRPDRSVDSSRELKAAEKQPQTQNCFFSTHH